MTSYSELRWKQRLKQQDNYALCRYNFGHSEIGTTMNIYTHFTAQSQIEIANAVNQLFKEVSY